MSSNPFALAGASLAGRKLKYPSLAAAIFEQGLEPQAIARLFKLSAGKRARADCALVILSGSVSKYRAHRETWTPEPEATLAKELVGPDFARVSDAAAKFVAKRWSEIEELAGGAAAA